jgi:Glycosyl transferases group 1
MPLATPRDAPSVLFLTTNVEDYLSDSLFHGLRTTLGDSVIDFPKKDASYRSYPNVAGLYGHGFTLYGLLEDLPLDRMLAMERARRGDFDLIVFGDIWRNFGPFLELLPSLDRRRTAFLDGADHEAPFPYSPALWRVPQWWTLPRAHTRGRYFKRELTVRTVQYRYCLPVPGRFTELLPFWRYIRPIAFSIPEEKIVDRPPKKVKPFPTHVVDAEVAGRIGAKSEYAFQDETDYYEDMRASRFGITTRRAGWDCLRHYELAANGCVLCFRDLDRKPPTCAPHGLEPGRNCVTYRDAEELLRKVTAITDDDYETLQAGSLAWAHANSTRRRAEEFLASMGHRRDG